MANKNTKTYLSNDELFKIIEAHNGDAQKISKEASINMATLKKRAYDISLETGKLVVLTNMDDIKDTAEFKKLGAVVSGKWLRINGFHEGQTFKLSKKSQNIIELKLAK
jgi:hypothetical protein